MEKYYSPIDFNAVYTSGSTITLSALPFTLTNSTQILFVKVIKADNTSVIFVNGLQNTITVSSNVLTIYENGVAIDSLLATDIYEVCIVHQNKGYDPSTNTQMVSRINPEWAHYTSVEHIVSATNIAAATNTVKVNMEGYKNISIHLKGSGGVTFKLKATLNENDNVGVDVSTSLLGVASLADSEGVYFIENKMPSDFIIEYVTVDETNAIDIWIRRY